jgi:hypothetical protein
LIKKVKPDVFTVPVKKGNPEIGRIGEGLAAALFSYALPILKFKDEARRLHQQTIPFLQGRQGV